MIYLERGKIAVAKTVFSDIQHLVFDHRINCGAIPLLSYTGYLPALIFGTHIPIIHLFLLPVHYKKTETHPLLQACQIEGFKSTAKRPTLLGGDRHQAQCP